jgi:hypothetical protein
MYNNNIEAYPRTTVQVLNNLSFFEAGNFRRKGPIHLPEKIGPKMTLPIQIVQI